MLSDVPDGEDGDADASILPGEAVIADGHVQLVAIGLIFITQAAGGKRSRGREKGNLKTMLETDWIPLHDSSCGSVR